MGKWKVLIADDEFIIRDGIRSSVNWESLNMEVVGEAEDGEEAVGMAIEHNIYIDRFKYAHYERDSSHEAFKRRTAVV